MKKQILMIVMIAVLTGLVLIGKFLNIKAEDNVDKITSLKNEEFMETNPIYFVKNGKTFKLSNINSEAKEISSVGGSLSPDKTKIAYTLSSSAFESEPYLYINNIDLKTTEKLPIETEYITSVNSWSPDSNKVVIIRHAQYVGGMRAYIFDNNEKKVIKKFNVNNNDGFWFGNNYVFSDPQNNCDDNINFKVCNSNGSSISLYNSKTNKVKVIKKLSNKLDVIAGLEKNISAMRKSIVYRELYFNDLNYYSDLIKEIDINGLAIKNNIVNSTIKKEFLINNMKQVLENPFNPKLQLELDYNGTFTINNAEKVIRKFNNIENISF